MKQYKRVPFDIELAKKIQSGEVEGRIICSCNIPVHLVNYVLLGTTDIIVIRADKTTHNEQVYMYKNNGIFQGEDRDYDLFIELPEEISIENHPASEDFKKGFRLGYDAGYLKGKEDAIEFGEKVKYPAETEEAPKHEFKPFDKVLVRDCSMDNWQISFFSHVKNDWFITNNGHMYKECIPFAGNEHLVGTTNNPY